MGISDEFRTSSYCIIGSKEGGRRKANKINSDAFNPDTSHQTVGVGGWEEEKLNVLKRVVEERRCKGPVEVMEVMVKEIRRRRNEEGWAIPLTPSLPRGRK